MNVLDFRYFAFRVTVTEKLLKNPSNPQELHPIFKGTDQEPFAHSLFATLMKYALNYLPIDNISIIGKIASIRRPLAITTNR